MIQRWPPAIMVAMETLDAKQSSKKKGKNSKIPKWQGGHQFNSSSGWKE